MKHVALLGSTGSIGRNALAVMADNPGHFNLRGISAGENIDLLIQQVKEFDPDMIAVKRSEDVAALQEMFPGKKVMAGPQGLLEIVNHAEVDTVITAITGTTPLEATLESIRLGHRICLANKETLVAAGELINRELSQSTSEIIPIDSEQSAIFQALGNNHRDLVHKVILTASGGPFFKKDKQEFAGITVQQALNHPTWSMGTKITIDSATLMNKALEVIETFYLFKLDKDQIDVIIHPQSIVHSLVEFKDASLIAQLSVPDMKIPILYSLTYPDRLNIRQNRLDLATMGALEFYEVERDKFLSIELAYYVLQQGKNSGAVFNAANEVAVEHFLEGGISFLDIFQVVADILYEENFYPVSSLEDLQETISDTKRKTVELIKRSRTK